MRPAVAVKLGVCPMSRNVPEVAILLADISGSTPLYEAIGDAAAARQIIACRDELRSIIARRGGTFIQSRGDDVLCTFAEPSSALRAARELLARSSASQLAIHGGMHVGPVVHAHGDIFGDAVNLTARLAALARSGEILTSKDFVDRMPPADRSSLRVLDTRIFKGKSTPTEIYLLIPEDSAAPHRSGVRPRFGTYENQISSGGCGRIGDAALRRLLQSVPGAGESVDRPVGRVRSRHRTLLGVASARGRYRAARQSGAGGPEFLRHLCIAARRP